MIKASRIADRADPGQVLVSNVVKELCEGKRFAFTSIGEVSLKGFDEVVALSAPPGDAGGRIGHPADQVHALADEGAERVQIVRAHAKDELVGPVTLEESNRAALGN